MVESFNPVTRLALGTVQFGLPYGIANKDGQIPRSVAKAMLRLAASKGIDTIDTAIAYGDSESCLGEVGTRGYKVVTKLPAFPDGHGNVKGWIQEQVTASLGRLKVSSVYGLLLHRSEQLAGSMGNVLFDSLQRLKEDGLVQKIGVSIYSPCELDALYPRYRFDLVQAPFNLIDRRLATSGWLSRLKQDGIEIHTRSAFLQGLLLMPRHAIPSKFAPWAELWDKWHAWCALNTVSAVQACLSFPLSFHEIDRVVIGADGVSQLEQTIGAATGAELDDLPDLQCEAEDLINPARWSQL